MLACAKIRVPLDAGWFPGKVRIVVLLEQPVGQIHPFPVSELMSKSDAEIKEMANMQINFLEVRFIASYFFSELSSDGTIEIDFSENSFSHWPANSTVILQINNIVYVWERINIPNPSLKGWVINSSDFSRGHPEGYIWEVPDKAVLDLKTPSGEFYRINFGLDKSVNMFINRFGENIAAYKPEKIQLYSV